MGPTCPETTQVQDQQHIHYKNWPKETEQREGGKLV